MSLSTPHTSSRSIGPFGWNAGGRDITHYHTVLPTAPSSMHLNIHRNLPRILKRDSMLMEPNGLASALLILDDQRIPPKRFIGIRRYTKRQVREVSERLAYYDPLRKPAEGRGKLPAIVDETSGENKKPKQKDIQNMVERLSSNKKALGEPGADRGKKLSKQELDALVGRLHDFDPQRHPANSRGVPARSNSYSGLVTKPRRLKESEAQAVYSRLARYDPEKAPAESPARHSAPAAKSKEMSEDQIEQLVDRLTSFNKNKWPAESAGTREPWMDGHHWNFKRTKTMP